MHNMIIRCLSVEITYVTDCSLGVRLYHDISAVIIGILLRTSKLLQNAVILSYSVCHATGRKVRA